jgi:CRISPR-associated protein Csm1
MPALDSLLERYCWCIPAGATPEVSLYHYAKSTAAVAGALYRFHEATHTETLEALLLEKGKRFLCITGDMSGIQPYIFDLKEAKQNAKLLRARSFQVWALSEIFAEYLARALGGGRESIITSAGGRFLLLVANTPGNVAQIPHLRLELERYSMNAFGGKLCFILSDGIPAGEADFKEGKVQALLNQIGTDAEWAKQRKMQAYLDAQGPVLETQYKQLQQYGACACCGTLPGTLPAEDDRRICPNCSALLELGGRLLRANKIILKTEQLLPFGDMVAIRQKDDPFFGYTINEYTPGLPMLFLPYSAPWVDKAQGTLKTFEEIAEVSQGNKKLALFKADIDNLGLVFSASLGSGASLARYAALSRLLHYFFSAHYTYLVGSHEEQNIYTVFSGGDDLCVIGPWDRVMHFAVDFRKELARFTHKNPSITLSAGISLASPNLPVRDMAENAEKALEESKQRKDPGNTRFVKDGITVFSTTLSWEEYEKALEEGKRLYAYMQENKTDTKKGVSAALLYRMLDFSVRAENFQNGNLRDKVWRSAFTYTVARNITDKAVKAWFSKWGTTDHIIKSRVAVSYALYANRT